MGKQPDVLAKLKEMCVLAVRQREEAESLIEKLTGELLSLGIQTETLIRVTEPIDGVFPAFVWSNSEERKGFFRYYRGFENVRMYVPVQECPDEMFWNFASSLISWINSVVFRAEKTEQKRNEIIAHLKKIVK